MGCEDAGARRIHLVPPTIRGSSFGTTEKILTHLRRSVFSRPYVWISHGQRSQPDRPAVAIEALARRKQSGSDSRSAGEQNSLRTTSCRRSGPDIRSVDISCSYLPIPMDTQKFDGPFSLCLTKPRKGTEME